MLVLSLADRLQIARGTGGNCGTISSQECHYLRQRMTKRRGIPSPLQYSLRKFNFLNCPEAKKDENNSSAE